jgi:hypothetical protein
MITVILSFVGIFAVAVIIDQLLRPQEKEGTTESHAHH